MYVGLVCARDCAIAQFRAVRSTAPSRAAAPAAKILAVGVDALTLSLDGHPEKIDDFEALLDGYGMVELQRTGRVALPKLDRQARLRAVKGKTG